MNGRAVLEILKEPQDRKILSYFVSVLEVAMIGQKSGRLQMGVMFISEHCKINNPHINFCIFNCFVTLAISIIKKWSENNI